MTLIAAFALDGAQDEDTLRYRVLSNKAYGDVLSDLEFAITDRNYRITSRNAIGAALARTTCQVSFFADTERRVAEAPEENFSKKIDHHFDTDTAIQQAFELLKTKAVQRGANPDHLEMEVIEKLEFNMVRGFDTTGKNIRVKVQVKPGLIHGYQDAIANLSE